MGKLNMKRDSRKIMKVILKKRKKVHIKGKQYMIKQGRRKLNVRADLRK